MPRNMSFMLTTEQIKNQTKTVTRRLGWWFLKPGDLLWACEKCQGLKKGEKVNKLALIRVVSSEPEELRFITNEEVAKEGFPDKDRNWFVCMFLKSMPKYKIGTVTFKTNMYTEVNRIEFEYVEGEDNG